MTVTPLVALARRPAAAPALAWPGGEMNAGVLAAALDTLGRGLDGAGAPGSVVAVSAKTRIELYLGVLAALGRGRPVLVLDPERPDRDECLAACAPGALLVFEGARGSGPGTARVEPRDGPATDAGPALLVPTSGTSSAARVAVLPAAALDAHVAASSQVLPPLGPGDAWLSCLPAATIGSLAALWRSLAAGACFAFLERFEAATARELMARGASHVSVVPAMLEPLATAAAPVAQALRCLLSGGGMLSAAAASHAQAQGWPLWNAWGMTETASHVAAGQVGTDWRHGVVGRPLPGVALETLDPAGQLRIRAPMLMSGYASAGLPPGHGLAPDGGFASSDAGEILPDGRLRLLGRIDDVIVTGGLNVHPATVEEVLAGCAGLREVAVSGEPDPRWGERLVALYVGDAEPAALDAWARAHLPSGLRPRRFLRVAALPRNAMGKVLRRELGQLGLEAESRRVGKPE